MNDLSLHTSAIKRWIPAPRLAFAGFLFGMLSVFLLYIILRHDRPPLPYTFERLHASNGVELFALETTPDHIRLQAIDSNVTSTPYTGVNGGFFWEGSLLSIAVEGDKPLKGEPGDYGSGWYNTGVNMNLKRGTLVWDEIARTFSVQVVTHAGELQVADRSRYWAQGGVSMSLGDEANWEREMIAEEMPAYDEGHMRTALVYDRSNRLYLIVTPTLCSVYEFRAAIVERLRSRNLADGVFLDGDGSSQLQARGVKLAGDHRQVYQMVAISGLPK